MNSTALDEFEQNGFIISNAAGNDSEFIVIEPETGIVRDINVINGYCGTYYYYDPQTGLAIDYGTYLTDNNHEVVGWCNIVVGNLHANIEIHVNGLSAIDSAEIEVVVGSVLIGAFGPDELIAALTSVGVTAEQITAFQATTWYAAFRLGSILTPWGTAISILKGSITEDLTQMWEHPWLQVKVNGYTVYSQMFVHFPP